MEEIKINGSGILPWDWEQERKDKKLVIIK